MLAPEVFDVDAEVVLFGAGDPETLLAAARTRNGHGVHIAELDFILDHAGESAEERLAVLDGWQPWESPGARYAGTAAGLTTFLLELLTHVDGVRLHPAELHTDTAEFTSLVLPALRRAGVLRPIQTGNTLRGILGLPKANNRFVAGQAPTATHPALEFSA